MTTREFVTALASQHIELWPDGRQLRYRGPREAVTPPVLAEITRKKDLLLDLLRKRDQPVFPLSHGQRALWYLHQLAPDSAAYHTAFGARIHSRIDAPALRAAFERLVDRHSMLRTTFMARGQEPVQAVHKSHDLCFEEIDASGWTWEKLTENARAAYGRPFDIERGPLLRVSLFTREHEEHVLLVTIHHLVCDMWSHWILIDELRTLYGAERRGARSPLPPLPLSYANYVDAQTELLAGAAGGRLRDFWQRQLAGELPVLNLPTDRPRPPYQRFRGGSHPFIVERGLTRRLHELAQAQHATLYMVLLAAFQVLLHRYTGQDEVLVGSPAACRDRREFAGLIGYFVNPVVFRANLAGNPTFQAFLGDVRGHVLAGLAHQEYPFPLLVQQLHPQRDPSRSPVVQADFVMQVPSKQSDVNELLLPSGNGKRVAFGDLIVGPFHLEQQEGQFDLTLEVLPAADALVAAFRYNRDLFEAGTIRRMAEHFQSVLESITANPYERLRTIPLLGKRERSQVLVEWNATTRDVPEHACVHDLFEAQVRQTPDRVAAVFEGRELTYRDLNERANRLASHLSALGVVEDVPVAVCMERSPDMLVALLGVLKAGGAYVPLDPCHPRERLAFMLHDSGSAVLVTQKDLLPSLPEHEAKVLCLDTLFDADEVESSKPPLPRSRPEHLAYVMYTSGSTGRPKGVQIEHRSVVNVLRAVQARTGFCESDVILAVSTIAFDVAAVELFMPLSIGATLVLVSQDEAADGTRLAERLRSSRATFMQATPSTWRLLLMAGWTGDPRLTIICTGEAMPRSLAGQLLDKGKGVWNFYGPTEATVYATAYPVVADEHGEPDWHAVMPIGRPVDNTTTYILDAQLNPVPIGVPGELCIGGLGLARGYRDRPELTAEKFIPDPFMKDAGARLYKTGDQARYLSDGNIEYLGRLDHQVKLRGFRIELGEIETVLSRHPDVQAAVVLCREDQPDSKRLVAYVVPRMQAPLGSSALRAFLRDTLPEYMLPAVFVILEELPLTPSGKIDRRALPAPEQTDRWIAEEPVLPVGPTEEVLAAIWAELLTVETVGRHDNFFDLGGHSLLAMKLVLRVQDILGVPLPVRCVVQVPTVAGIARVVDRFRSGETLDETLPRPPANLEEDAILAPAIHPRAPAAVLPSDHTGSGAVLLTGGTGFLGTYLLSELLQQTAEPIYCLVRARDEEEGFSRLQGKLEGYGLWNDAFRDRVRPVIGDLAKPGLGFQEEALGSLADKIGVIYHSGAKVNLTHPYAALRDPNVEGTRAVLKLATLKEAKPVHYVSTLSVFDSADYFDGRVIGEDTALSGSEGLLYGYAQSKWVAEKLVAAAGERGLPTTIYRPGAIVGPRESGVWNPDDVVSRAITGCIQLGQWPDLDVVWPLTPVDYVSKAILHLARRPDSAGKAYHLVNPSPVSAGQLYEWVRSLGYAVERVPSAVWRSELLRRAHRSEDNALLALLPLFLEKVPFDNALTLPEIFVEGRAPKYDCRHALAGLAGSSISCPIVDSKWLERCLPRVVRGAASDASEKGRNIA